MAFVDIDDPHDRRLDDYRNVPDPDLVARRGIFIAEGRFVVSRLLTASPLATRSVMVTLPARASLGGILAKRPDLPVYVVPQALMNGITGFNIHRGCLAVGERPPARPWQDVTADARTIVALERVANADNVGGVFRNAAAFGAGAVLLDPTSTDPLYRKAIRTSMGTALIVPFARVDPLPAALDDLRQRGYAVIALTPSGTATLGECAAANRGRRIVVVLGHEGEGLTQPALDACTDRVRIPMASGIDSLNIVAAAAVALYELSA